MNLSDDDLILVKSCEGSLCGYILDQIITHGKIGEFFEYEGRLYQVSNLPHTQKRFLKRISDTDMGEYSLNEDVIRTYAQLVREQVPSSIYSVFNHPDIRIEKEESERKILSDEETEDIDSETINSNADVGRFKIPGWAWFRSKLF